MINHSVAAINHDHNFDSKFDNLIIDTFIITCKYSCSLNPCISTFLYCGKKRQTKKTTPQSNHFT